MNILFIVLIFVLSLATLIVASCGFGEGEDGAKIAFWPMLFILLGLSSWYAAASLQPSPILSTESYLVTNVDYADGTKDQIATFWPGNNFDVTAKFGIILPEGSKIELRRMGHWVGGIYWISDDYQYAVILPSTK